MGTLTAGQPRLESYCDHKLPTSCRLSSIGECCACYDERQHSSTYSTYIDGIGFVSRGTRWQRYCWFCKEFWEKRIEASGLEPHETRIPHVPDQSEFLQRWYEFHQGFRVVTRADGSEERIAVLGEELKDVAPGCLPRTLEELRAGRERSELEEQEREQTRLLRLAAQEDTTETGPSLEETLDELFLAAATDESRTQQESEALSSQSQQPIATQSVQQATEAGQDTSLTVNVHAQSMVPTGSRNREYQARRVAALRRELFRMRSGIERVISGLRDLGETVPDPTDASNRLANLGQTLDAIAGVPSREDAQQAINSVNALTATTTSTPTDRSIATMQARVDEARQHADEAQRSRDQAASELDLADRELRTSRARLSQLRNEQRSLENYIRLFGSREEVVAQGENYESPIGGMFSRAMERFRVAEEVRREERHLREYLAEEQLGGDEEASELLESLGEQQRDVWGVPRPTQRFPATPRQTQITQYTSPPWQNSRLADASRIADQNYEAGLQEYYSLLRRQDWRQGQIEALQSQSGADVANGLVAEDSSRNLRRENPAAREDEARSSARADEGTRAVVAGPPGEQLDTDPVSNNDRGLDALFVLNALSENESLRSHLPRNNENPSPESGRPFVLRLISTVTSNSLVLEDRDIIQTIVQNPAILWGSGLPAERNRRRRERGEHISFSPVAREMAEEGQTIVHDVEVMAEAYQMSVQIRRLSGLNAPEQLRMLYRLQRGERDEATRLILEEMLRTDLTQSRAREVHEQHANDMDPAQSNRHAALEHERRTAARQGDHSRAELDAQRRATHSVALAAGQLAMRTSTATLLQRMADRDDETRAAYQRLQDNGFVPPQTMTTRRLRDTTVHGPLNGEVDSDDESDDEGKGLDAPDTGRPEEPMTEEQMTVKLNCQVCYSQMATIALLPCGHLSMCQWCSDQHSPTMAHDRTRPRRAAACPVCRKGIRQKVKVFRS